ncbi:HalOD1 output domain-containing protein [Halodesulfurarchaeum formicicum]|nr:HalOD1 output domain-containing protein [Halodesulfurarchaeum formicicum]
MDNEGLAYRVIEAVAQKSGKSPESLSPPLYDVIDPDALDALMAHSSEDVRVSFKYNGYNVQVSGDGTVSVTSSDAMEPDPTASE